MNETSTVEEREREEKEGKDKTGLTVDRTVMNNQRLDHLLIPQNLPISQLKDRKLLSLVPYPYELVIRERKLVFRSIINAHPTNDPI